MRNSRWYSILCLVMLAAIAASSGCIKIVPAGGATSSLLSDATLSTDIDSQSRPVSASNTFTVTTDMIYLSLKLNNAPANTQVMAKMTYLGGEAASLANSTMFNNSQTGQGNGYMSFAMKAPPGGFPQGNYQVSVSANGQQQMTVPFTVQNLSAGKAWPAVNKFTASQDTIPAGQSVTLSWDVSNATRITLQPEIGTIDPAGTRSVSPSVTTTYKIIASNDAGSTTRELTVNVGAAVTGAADLVITDLWLEGCMVYYKIKNVGTIDSTPTTTYIYVDNLLPTMGWSSYVDVLKPGQEKGMVFSSYQWPWCGQEPQATTAGGAQATFSQSVHLDVGPSNYPHTGGSSAAGPVGYVDWNMNHIVKVCADAKNESIESDKTNNCLMKIFGILFDYDLLPVAHLAGWKNGSGNVPDFGNEGSPAGAFIKMGDGSLETVPEQVPQGWIQGYWGAFYTDTETHTAQVAYIKLPPRTHLLCNVGLASDATGSDGVNFVVGLKDMSDTMNFLPGKKMTVPGQFQDWDINLSDYEGQKVLIVLRVEAGASPVNDHAIWKQARLVQVP